MNSSVAEGPHGADARGWLHGRKDGGQKMETRLRQLLQEIIDDKTTAKGRCRECGQLPCATYCNLHEARVALGMKAAPVVESSRDG